MAVYNIIPNQFTADDVRDTLNANGGSVGNNWMDYFSLSANINPWSKKKPVRRSIDFNDFDANWFKADSGNFGIYYPNSADINLLTGVYSYEIPLGGTHRLRMGDFSGYYPSAVKPFTILKPLEGAVIGFPIAGLIVGIQIKPLDSDKNITVADLFPSNSHLGCAVTTGITTRIKVNSTNIFAGGDTLNISDCPLFSQQGAFSLKIFLTTSTAPTWESAPPLRFYSLNIVDNYAETNFTAIEREKDVWSLGIQGLAIEDRSRLLLGSNSVSGGYINRQGTYRERLSKSYTLKHLVLRTVRSSDGYVCRESTVSYDSNTSPVFLDRGDYIGMKTSFLAPIAGNQGSEILPPNDHYIFETIMVYT